MVPLSQLRNLDTIGKFTGKLEDFEMFRSRLLAFLSDVLGMSSLLEWVAKQKDDITDEDVDLHEGPTLPAPSSQVSQQLPYPSYAEDGRNSVPPSEELGRQWATIVANAPPVVRLDNAKSASENTDSHIAAQTGSHVCADSRR